MIGQQGANWVGGGEMKALHRIIKPVIADDEDAAPGLGHNRPPAGAVVHNVRPEALALEEQIAVVTRAMNAAESGRAQAERLAIVAGRELLKLQRIWRAAMAIEPAERQKEIGRLAAEGMKHGQIGVRLGISPNSVKDALKKANRGQVLGPPTGRSGGFTKWAAARFGKKVNSINYYLHSARDPERQAETVRRGQDRRRQRVLAGQVSEGKVGIDTFKKAFLSLLPPEREAIFRWIASMQNHRVD